MRPLPANVMWKRNLFFVAVLLGGALAVRAALFTPPVPAHAADVDTSTVDSADFRIALAQLNAAVTQRIGDEGLEAAPPADELAIARRVSLALTGTIPSLQEIRQFEAYQGNHRLAWW